MLKNFDKWIKGQDYGAYVLEKEGNDRHIHAQVWLNTARTKGNIDKPLKKMLARCYNEGDYILKHALCTKGAWDDKFCDEYMQKDETLLYKKLPAVRTAFYPTEAEQEEFMKIAETRKNWTIWRQLETEWNAEERVINKYEVANFLGQQMFVKDNIKVVQEKRKRMEMCETFLAVLLKENNNFGRLFLPKDSEDMYNLFQGKKDKGK